MAPRRIIARVLVVLAAWIPLATSDNCQTIQVQSGDSCGSLANRCGISGNQFMQYNPQPNLCSTLQVGQYVCCTNGTLPDEQPQQNANGSCATYSVQSGDYCSLIAQNHSLTVQDLENFNNNTWGWAGCDYLQADFVMCLSTGSPPMPAAVANAECGPQVPGTPQPADMSTLAGLNPCSLNACCDKWGQCGTTSEFCTISLSSTGAPGTSAPGTNGCISNCGTAIISGDAPAEFRKVGYFEAWNGGRPCLTMAPVDIDTSQYTHVHFAFGNISSGSWNIDVSGYQEFYNQFKGLTGVNRILSFGGWAFSTDQSTYDIFRQAVSADNYQTFASNVASFIQSEGLNGVDFDWEYPGELDIPGIPPSSTIDPANYLNFLTAVRNALPSQFSISIAAPASYWYLKAFPLANITEQLDYVVFMTYDFHGQWDYQNTYADSGCPGGSCLRCHVNLTETENSLSMITKAGVPSSKVVVGIANYARSFGMTDSSCTGPDCTFTGPQSGATPGECTQVAGYISNAELAVILASDSSASTWIDQDSNCNIMTYGDNWAGFMDDNITQARTSQYQGLNMGGTTLWAIDLGSLDEGNANDTVPVCDTCPMMQFDVCDQTFATLEDLLNTSGLPGYCVNQYLVQTLSTMVNALFVDYSQLNNGGYEKKFSIYADAVQNGAPPEVVQFINSNANTYFDCTGGPTGTPGGPPIDDGESDQQCPADLLVFSQWTGPAPYGHWEYIFTNETGFYEDLLVATGVQQGWMSLQNYSNKWDEGSANPSHSSGPRATTINWYNVPYPVPDFAVPDPGAAVANALQNYTLIQSALNQTGGSFNTYFVSDLTDDSDNTTTASAVQAFVLPVLMMNQSISQMNAIVAFADTLTQEEQKAKRNEIILDIFTGIGFFLPFLSVFGEIPGLLGELVNILKWAGTVDNEALDIYNTVQDPSNIGALIIDTVGAVRDLTEAAGVVRRAEEAGTLVQKFGSSVGTSADAISNKVIACV